MRSEAGPGRSTQILYGALAGFAATALMTSAMWRLHRRLPEEERYPLPPREITDRVLVAAEDDVVRDTAMTSHFLYGALAGALICAVRPPRNVAEGGLAGLAVWAGSYFGWVPALGILRPASDHPPRRNALMIMVHLIWGSVTALTMRELLDARRTILNGRPPEDAVLEARP